MEATHGSPLRQAASCANVVLAPKGVTASSIPTPPVLQERTALTRLPTRGLRGWQGLPARGQPAPDVFSAPQYEERLRRGGGGAPHGRCCQVTAIAGDLMGSLCDAEMGGGSIRIWRRGGPKSLCTKNGCSVL